MEKTIHIEEKEFSDKLEYWLSKTEDCYFSEIRNSMKEFKRICGIDLQQYLEEVDGYFELPNKWREIVSTTFVKHFEEMNIQMKNNLILKTLRYSVTKKAYKPLILIPLLIVCLTGITMNWANGAK